MGKEKPSKCKFCSGSSKLNVTYLGNDKEECFCACNKCRCQTAVYTTPEEAIAAWNRKPEDEPITAEGLERMGFARSNVTDELSTLSLKNDKNEINVSFYFDTPEIITIYQEKLTYTVIVFLPHVKTIQDIADLKRLFLGIDGED